MPESENSKGKSTRRRAQSADGATQPAGDAAGLAPPARMLEVCLASQANFQPWLPTTRPSTTSAIPATFIGVIGSLKNHALHSMTSTKARLMNG